jgi:O-antigen ligase
MTGSLSPQIGSAGVDSRRWFAVTDGALIFYVASAGFSTALGLIFAFLAMLTWLVGTAREQAWVGRFPLLRPHLVFGAVSLLAALVAADVVAGLSEIRTEWAPYLLMVTVADRMSEPGRARRTLNVLIGAGTVMGLWGLLQTIQHGTTFRVRGAIGYMTYSEIVMMIAMIALGRMVFESTMKRSLRWLPVVAVLFAALLMTQTRGAWLGAMVGATVLVWIRDKRFVLLLPVVAVLFTLVAPESVRARLEGLVDLSDITAKERVYMWRGGIAIALDHPLTGVGPGNVRQAWPEYRLPDDPWLDDRPWTHTHSNLVQVAAERGLLGLATWLSIWVAWFVLAWRTRPREELQARALWAAGVAATFAFLVAGLSEWSYGDTEVVYLAYFMMALPLTRKGPD